MTDLQRQNLMVAAAFAHGLIQNIHLELNGGSSERRQESALQLEAALQNLEDANDAQHMH